MIASPVIGVTCDISETSRGQRGQFYQSYINAVVRSGGVPVVLAPVPELIGAQISLCRAFVLTGGDDPLTEEFGVPTDPRVTPLHPLRQSYEVALVRRLLQSDKPTLGVCLGMQLMGLCAGGRLDQHLPASCPTADEHWEAVHRVDWSSGVPGLSVGGGVLSRHRQAIASPGSLRIAARSPDGVIEAIDDPGRRFFLGVQWHPERTDDPSLGRCLFDRLVDAARLA